MMDLHVQVNTGKMDGWGFGFRWSPRDCFDIDFLRWYIIVTWHKG